MNFGNDMYAYDIERIADLKSMAEYGKRTIKRLQDELKEAQQVIEKQMLIIDNINNLFATTKASTYCTNEQSIIYKTLSKEISPQKSNSTLQEMHEPIGDLYNYPQTAEIIESLKNATDFQEFFFDFPLAFAALFDQSPILFSTDEIILEVETWATERRIDFFTAFFEHLNSAAFFLSSLLSIVDCQSIPILSEYLETGLSTILNCSRIAFFIFDNEENELIMEKHQLQMRMQIKEGIIYESLMKNKLSLVSRNFEKVSKDDLVLLKKNQVILSIPVYCNSSPTALLLLYDKIGGFKQYDYLVGQTLSKFISQAIPIITLRQDRKKIAEMLNESLDTFLQIISVNNLKSFLQVIPDTFSNHFQCENTRIYQILDDCKFYSEIVDEEVVGNSEKFPIDTGIVGQSISQMEPIRIVNPELSQSFCPEVDRANASTMTHSILICPILSEDTQNSDKKPVPRYVIALYNKKNLESFTDIDIEKIKIICENLDNIFTSLLETSNLTVAVENSHHTVSLYNSLFNMFSELSSKITFNECLETLTATIKSTFNENSTVDLFYINRPFNNISSAKGDYSARLLPKDTDNEQDPIAYIASKSETKEIQNETKTEILCGLKNLKNEPVGLIKITAKDDDDDSGTNLNRKNSLSAFRSSAKMNPVKTSIFKDLNNKQVEKLVSFWEELIGPILNETINKDNIAKLIRVCDNLIGKLPSDPSLAVPVYNEIQFMMNSNVQIEDVKKKDELIVTFIEKNDEYYQKTRDLIVSFSLLLASTQKDPENEEEEELNSQSKNKSFNFVPDSNINSILNDSNFDVFFYQDSFLNEIIVTSLYNLGILKFLSIGYNDAVSLVNELKEIHISNGFKTWELAVDHFQFATFLIQNLGKTVSISIEQISALMLYLLSLYCVPYLKDPEMNLDKPMKNYVYSPSELITKFYIENGKGISPLSSFIAAVSGMTNQSAIKTESIDVIAPLMKKLDSIQTFDFLNTGELYIFIACISQYSYLARPAEIAKKWIDKRIKEEIIDEEEDKDEEDKDSLNEEIMKSQIDFDVKSILIPTFGEFMKRDIKIDHIRKLFITTVSKVTGNSF